MMIEKCVRFERLPDVGASETELFALAFNPIARLKEYPDLLGTLAKEGVADYDAAQRITHALATGSGDQTDLFTDTYIHKARHVLVQLDAALKRDLDADYAPTSPKLVSVLLDTRREQIGNIQLAIKLSNYALAALYCD